MIKCMEFNQTLIQKNSIEKQLSKLFEELNKY